MGMVELIKVPSLVPPPELNIPRGTFIRKFLKCSLFPNFGDADGHLTQSVRVLLLRAEENQRGEHIRGGCCSSPACMND